MGEAGRREAGERPGGLEHSTVLIAGAACSLGAELCHGYAGSGARVVAVDADEPALLDIASAAPHRIDPLALDVMRPDVCRRLGDAWAEEPLNVCVHMAPLRAPARPAAAMAAVEALVAAFSAGLRAGRGRVLILADTGPPDTSVTAELLQGALRRLAPALQTRYAGGGVVVNAVLLPHAATETLPPRALWQAVAYLTAPGGAGGAVLPLLGRSD